MSTVYFDSPGGGIALAPWNARDILAGLCSDSAERILNAPGGRERLLALAGPAREAAYRRQPDQLFADMLFDREGFAWKGRPLSMGDVIGNTALRAGPDALRLAARLHWQCEVHCWCEGSDRAWLAGIIGEGLRPGGLFASGPGRWIRWEPVVEFLRSRDDEPVVLSWANGGEFPLDYHEFTAARYAEAGWEPSGGDDPANDWLDLTEEAQWTVAMSILRAQPPGLQVTPGTWSDHAFGHGLSASDILSADYAGRLDRALPG